MSAAELTPRAVDDVVRGVSGVGELFYASPLPARLWRAGTGGGAFSVVTSRSGAPEVIVSIGVAAGRADDTARLVAAAVRAAFGDPGIHVTVRISRIDTR